MLEKLDAPGGRAYVHRQDGFTFDGGPTIITAPTSLTARSTRRPTTSSSRTATVDRYDPPGNSSSNACSSGDNARTARGSRAPFVEFGVGFAASVRPR